jgi:ribulose-phosphate 3-epimerase
METEVIPAILVKSREDLLKHINRVSGSVSSVHIDVMDNKFVPNSTVGPESFSNLPKGISYEFHWMVEAPENYILQTRGDHLHIVHVEAIGDWEAIKKAAKASGGRLGIAINPATPEERLQPFIMDVSRVLVMTVVPGFDGQKYIPSAEEKIRSLRSRFPGLQIEVDGGINPETARSAAAAGADKLAASSAIYRSQDVRLAVESIRNSAEMGKGGRHG